MKIITTGEGGVAITNNKNIEQKMRLYAGHGITRDPEMMVGTPEGPWYYEQLELGYNYRMTDIQAALGISQLQRLDQFVAKRNELAANYDGCWMDFLLHCQRPTKQFIHPVTFM